MIKPSAAALSAEAPGCAAIGCWLCSGSFAAPGSSRAPPRSALSAAALGLLVEHQRILSKANSQWLCTPEVFELLTKRLEYLLPPALSRMACGRRTEQLHKAALVAVVRVRI